jgi:2,3-bisphosphoglycerate-independent phosphoglycerate mutase
MELKKRPCVLLVLDGFGVAPPSEYNAVSRASMPFYDSLINTYPTVLLDAAGLSVGLPFGEVGNSEVGHYNLGSGQLLYQSLPRINISIDDESFYSIDLMQQVTQRVKTSGKKLHLVGMIGTGGVHSHQKHLYALIEFCKREQIEPEKVFIHAFLDGRDTAKDVGKKFMEQVLKRSAGVATLATIAGRFYAMDRNNKWDRTEKTYRAMTEGKAERTATDPIATIQEGYDAEMFDEEFEPTVMLRENGQPVTTIDAGDTIIFFNFRADRARQITQSFVEADFNEFERGPMIDDLAVISFTEYKKGLPVHILFPPQIVENSFAKILSDQGLQQYHVAETEKYAHVTFFFNGLIEKPFPGEVREIVPSPAVVTYDEKPEMSAEGVTDKILEALESKKYDFILSNFANADMVGHTGNLEASIKALEFIDTCLARIIPAVLEQGGICFITADHGNVEEVLNYETYEIDKEHSIYPVPFLTISKEHEGKVLYPPKNGNDLSVYEPVGVLADVAPTMLDLIGVPRSPEMKGGLKID